MKEIKVGDTVRFREALIIPNKFKEEGENRPGYVMFPC
jgi:hypothetical protein